VILGQVIKLLKLQKPIVEEASGNSCVPFVVGINYTIEHPINSVTHFGTDKDKWVPMEHMPQIGVNLLQQIVFSLVFILLFYCLPLVDGNHNRPSFLDGLADYMEILYF
jgi:hypothetical protein